MPGRSTAIRLLVASSALAVLGSSSSAQGFISAATYGDDAPRALLASDFNRDGRPDLAAAYLNTGVRIYLGDGQGLVEASFHASARFPAALTSGDFDGDGNTDLAVAEHAGPGVRILMGDGKGGFVSRGYAGDLAVEVASADFNHDGMSDLVATTAGRIVVLLARGRGRFHPASVVDEGFFNSEKLLAKDVDLDGHANILAFRPTKQAGRLGYVALLWGDGAGRFDSERLPAPFAPQRLAAEDFDRDGRIDLAVAGELTAPPLPQVASLVARGIGPRAFGPFEEQANLPFTEVADLTGDGLPDLLTPEPQGIGVLASRGDGTFAPGRHHGAGRVSCMAIADFNGDGAPDAAACTSPRTHQARHLALLLSEASSDELRSSRTSVVHHYPWFRSGAAAAGDFDGDASVDVVVASHGVLRGDSAGRFTPRTPHLNGPIATLLAEDMDRDGHLDVVTTGYEASTFSVYLGDGSGGFRERVTYSLPGGASSWMAAAGDLDGDRDVDLVLGRRAGFGPLLVRLNDGMGRLLPAVTIAELPLQGLRVGDVDGDGRLDVIEYDIFEGSILVRLGDGRGLLGPRIPTVVPRSAGSLSVVDLDGDGRVDVLLATGSETAGHIQAYFGTAAGVLTPGPGVDLPAAGGVATSALSDGRTLLVVGPTAAGRLHVIAWTGSAFQLLQTIQVGDRGDRPLLADVDGNGRVDVVLVEGSGLYVTTVMDAASADISVGLDNATTALAPGEATSFTVVVENAGPDDARGVVVRHRLRGPLQAGAWSCIASPTASCTAAGVGELADHADIPVGGRVTYTASASVTSSHGCVVTEAFASEPARGIDPHPEDNHAVDQDAIVSGLTLKSSEVVVSERGRRAKFVVNLAKPACTEFALPWATEDGSAVAGLDYVGSTGEIGFHLGSKKAVFDLAILDDTLIEPAEDLFVRLLGPVPLLGHVTITDDDGARRR